MEYLPKILGEMIITLKNDGTMAASEWVYDENYSSWYYLKEDGKYARK